MKNIIDLLKACRDNIRDDFDAELIARIETTISNEERREAEETERKKHGHDQAVSQAECIAQMVAALEVDYGRLEELRDKRKAGHWVAGRNMPGFMPDNAPEAFETCDEAREYIVDMLRNAAGDAMTDDTRTNEETDAEETALITAADELAETVGERDAEYGQTFAGWHYWITHKPGELADPEEAEELRELEAEAGDCESRDDAEERIQEDPLSIEVRSDWHTPGEEGEPDEFMILLCTGGPAVRIVGELDQYRQPCRAWIEFQDWFTPWRDLLDTPIDSDTLLTYCQQFHFGE